jgi:ATP-binding cassette subfamily B protein
MFRMGGVDEADRLDSAEKKRVFRRTATMAVPFRRTLIGAIAFTSLSTLGLVCGPLLVRYGIDHGIDAGDSAVLRNAVIAYLVIVAAAYLASRQQYVLINRAGEGFLQTLRVRVFDHIQRQSLAFFDKNKSGVLIARMTADVESMGELIQFGLLQFLSAGLLVFMALILLFVLSWQLTLLVLVVFPIILVASVRFQRDSNKAYLQVRERVGSNLSALQEGISGVRVIQAFGREDEQSRRFQQSNTSLFDTHMHSIRISMWYFALVEFCGVLATAGMIGVGGWLVHRGSVKLGVVTAFVLLLSSLFEPVQQRVERRHLEGNRAIRPLFDQLADVVAVPRGLVDQGEHQQGGAAALELTCRQWCGHRWCRYI